MTKVERLHSEGKKYYSYPYRLYVLDNTDGDADETVISVPKKIFKRAVKRNLGGSASYKERMSGLCRQGYPDGLHGQ